MDSKGEFVELLFLMNSEKGMILQTYPSHRQSTKAAETCLFKQSNWGKWCVGLSERNVMTARGHEECSLFNLDSPRNTATFPYLSILCQRRPMMQLQ